MSRMQRLLTGFCLGIGCVVFVAIGGSIALGKVAFDTVAKSIVLIDTGDGIGTGFFIASDEKRSIILTAQHVLGSKKRVKVYANAGYRGSFVATIMREDRDRDLALLSVPTGPFPTLRLAASVTSGEAIAAGGFDQLAYRYFKSSGDLQPNFHPGSVSSIRGPLVVHDVPTDEGNSGGPLFDVESGDVVGVVKGSFNLNYLYAAVGPVSIKKFLREAGVQANISIAIQTTPTPQAPPAQTRGRGVPANYAALLRTYQLSAAKGDAYGETGLGLMYQYGRGVPKNYATALHYYQLAAAQGDVHAEIFLARMYEQGLGVPKADATAVHYYQLAATQGDPYAEYTLGTRYEQGRGVPKDDATALHYYQLAAAKRYAPAVGAVARLSKPIKR